MSGRVTSSRLVGRAAELDELQSALADAAAGRPALAFLAGDSGVGKTRVLSELHARARAAGARVLTGDAVQLGEGELPYAALVSALRPLARDHDPVLDELDPHARAELSRLLPRIGAATEAGGRVDDSAAQGRLFEAVLALLDRLGAEAPVLLTLEDLHWADPSTRTFVAFMARSLCRERVLLVATYRLDELHRRHPLRPLLAELERDPFVRRVELPPLSREELAVALEDIVGRPPHPDLVSRLHARSEGNPLFMEEILASSGDGRGALPSSLRDALMVRIERLSEPAQAVVRTLAIGTRLDDDLLAIASGLERPELRAGLREAVASHLVVAGADDHYRFRHALLREVVEDDLLPGERADLHLALARALETRSMGAQIAVGIAHHYAAAGDQPAALAAAVRAAAAAESMHAYGEAAALLERALELWDRVPDAAELAGVDRVSVLRRAADAHLAAGDDVRPEPLLRRALELVDERAQPRRAAAILERLAHAQRRLGHTKQSRATAERALELVGPEPSSERAGILSWWAQSRMLQGRFREAVDAAREAIAVAEAVANDTALARALNALGVALAGLGSVDEGAATLRRAIAIARERDRLAELESAQVNLAEALHAAGRTREALAIARDALADAPRHGYRTDALATVVAELLTELGDWEAAAGSLPPTGRRTGVELVNVELRRIELALGRAEHGAAGERLARLDEHVAASTEPQWHAPYGALAAELRRRQGDLDAARMAVDDALDRIEFCTDDVARLARVSAAGVTVEADRALRDRDLGDEDGARRSLATLEDFLLRVEAAAEGGMPVERAWLATARADAARARGGDVAAAWRLAGDAWTALERPYRAAVARWREGEAHAAADRRRLAAETLRPTLATARRMGAAWLASEIAGLARRARLDLDEGAEPEAAPDEVDAPFGLTPRERQVLALVANGATNREIGSRLYMAEKTASVHVSRILAKLDVRSRTQAAAVAHRLGLAE